MENLTKQQIVLLTLLVSFVTSIATGIVTVTLMDQAPVGVTQTINRVVEKTIERVVPVVSEPSVKNTTTVTKETVVVKEDDLIVSAIERNLKSFVKISGKAGYFSEPVFSGSGVVVSKDGLVMTDSSLIFNSFSYTATFPDGRTFPLELLSKKEGSRIAILKILSNENLSKSLSLDHATLGDSDTVKMGQTVISLGGKEKIVSSIGSIYSIESKDRVSEDTSTNSTENKIDNIISVRHSIEANLSPKDDVTGGPLVNLLGEVVGIKVDQYNSISYVPINLAKDLLSDLKKTSQATSTGNI